MKLTSRARSTMILRVGYHFVRMGVTQVPSPGLPKLVKIICRQNGRSAPPPKDRAAQWAILQAFDASLAKQMSENPEMIQAVAQPPLPKTVTRKQRQAFYETDAWRELRYRALKLHGATCQCCGATAKSSGQPLHVDHIKPRFKHPELELDLSNLQVLCRDCNLGKSAWDETDWRESKS